KRLWRLERMWRWFPILLIVGFMPVHAALIQGQDSLILLLLLAAALMSVDRAGSLMAGFMLGLGLFRFQIVLPIVFLFFIWRRWRLLFGACVSSLIAVVLCTFVSGISGLRLYAHRLYEISLGRQGLDLALYGIPVTRMPNLR